MDLFVSANNHVMIDFITEIHFISLHIDSYGSFLLAG